MYKRRLSGSYYEIGRAHGRLLKRGGFAPSPLSEAKMRLTRACEAVVSEHLPELWEELCGVAEGSGFDPHMINAIPLTLNSKGGCSAFAVSGERTASGKVMFGRNYDLFPWFRRFTVLYRTYADGALASIGCSDHWVGRDDGVNEAGVAVAIANVPGHRDHAGVMFSLAARAVLDRCRNTDEAVALLEGIPHVRNTNFLVADAKGRIAVVEVGPAKVNATYASKGFAAITNHFQSDVMAEYERVEGRDVTSVPRRQNLQEWFTDRSGPVTAADALAVMSDCNKGTCQYRTREPGRPEPVSTLWSWMAQLDERRVQLAIGSPNRASYNVYDF